MVAYSFDKILARGIRAGQIPARTRDAREWYRDTAQATRVAPNAVMKGEATKLVSRPLIGRMYLFNYDPKMKKTLPYYDRFPLIFQVGPAQGGFMGINMHYLPYQFRAILMDRLYDLVSNKKYDESTRLRVSYNILKSASRYKYFKPTLKRYLNEHVRSRFLQIDSVEWDIALFLPIERFTKKTKEVAWRDSRRAI